MPCPSSPSLLRKKIPSSEWNSNFWHLYPLEELTQKSIWGRGTGKKIPDLQTKLPYCESTQLKKWEIKA